MSKAHVSFEQHRKELEAAFAKAFLVSLNTLGDKAEGLGWFPKGQKREKAAA